MPLPVPNLDDRRFDDLVTEARARLAGHLPELTQVGPGDPVHAFIDLFAWLTETIIYRANLIPERQRRVFLNLLQIPVRAAVPARGFICIDGSPTSTSLPPLVRDGSQLRAGKIALTTLGELQPTCLSAQILAKVLLTKDELADLNISLQDLHEQYGLRRGQIPQPYRSQRYLPGKETLTLSNTLDNSLYLACIAPKALAGQMTVLRESLAGLRLSVAIAPADNVVAEEAEIINSREDILPRPLKWELVAPGADGSTRFLPLEVMSDTSAGGRNAGVVRLKLPQNSDLFASFAEADPMFNGTDLLPPAPEDEEVAGRVAFWVRLRCPDEPDLELGYLGINAAEVIAQGLREDLLLTTGTGQPEQIAQLPDTDIDLNSVDIQVEENGRWVSWTTLDFTSGQGPEARVVRLDPATGYLYFGDGSGSGKRPPRGARIRAASYRYGGGSEGNLPAGSVKELVDGSSRLRVRHDWPLTGGRDAETLAQAEQRIPQFLTHRNRAVTSADFRTLCLNNPVSPVARAEVREGFLPGSTLAAAQRDVPGAISVFVLPPGEVSVNQWPRPTRGLLKDVFNYLINRVLVGTELYVLSPQFVPMAVSVLVTVSDPGTEQETMNQVSDAVTQYLSPLAPGGSDAQGWPLGRAVRANELLVQAARIPGVLSVAGIALFTQAKDEDGRTFWRRLTANESLVLDDYQLPQLAGIHVGSAHDNSTGAGGSAIPPLPQGMRNQNNGDSEHGVAVPVIPDVC